MAYRLVRTRDGAGDSGPMSDLFKVKPKDDYYEFERDEDGKIVTEHNAAPKVGYCIRVGSPFSRTFAQQDYWTTTPITEILEKGEKYVKFRTTNSVYEWYS